ncbi:MAG: cobalamin-binding protein [Caldimonas sp.]
MVVATAHALVLADDAGRTIEFARPPQRIVTLAPSLTELVFAAGGGAAVVGTDRFSDAPDAARRIPRVGDASRLDVERVIGLRPDLVIVWRHGNNLRELGQLEAAGIRLFFLEPRRLDDVPRAIERLGVLLGHDSEAKARAATLRESLEQLRRAHRDAVPVSVYFQVWSTPLMTINGEQLINDVIALCGGRNVFAGLAPLVPVISTESVVAADPQAMFTADREEGGGAWLKRDPTHPAFALWRRQPTLTAVRRGWLFAINGDAISRQGPRIVAGAEAMCSALDTVRHEARAEKPGSRPGSR